MRFESFSVSVCWFVCQSLAVREHKVERLIECADAFGDNVERMPDKLVYSNVGSRFTFGV